MLASLALVITIATPSSIITLIASIILRLIFSVGVEPTLWLLGVLNVSIFLNIIELRHEIPNHVVCAASKTSDQPARTCSLIRAFASRLNIL